MSKLIIDCEHFHKSLFEGLPDLKRLTMGASCTVRKMLAAAIYEDIVSRSCLG